VINILNRDATTNEVVLTKADKNVKGADPEKNPGKVSNREWKKLLEMMKANKVENEPIVLTSANTRLGRDGVWKYLRLAAVENQNMREMAPCS
jgi:GTP-binding protein EngB required for normal cell division